MTEGGNSDEEGTEDEAASDPPSPAGAGGEQEFAEIQVADTMPLIELTRKEVPDTPRPVKSDPRPMPATPGIIAPATPAAAATGTSSVPMTVDAAPVESGKLSEPAAKRQVFHGSG